MLRLRPPLPPLLHRPSPSRSRRLENPGSGLSSFFSQSPGAIAWICNETILIENYFLYPFPRNNRVLLFWDINNIFFTFSGLNAGGTGATNVNGGAIQVRQSFDPDFSCEYPPFCSRTFFEMGSDTNAQIETNRNTALTLACFQGRQWATRSCSIASVGEESQYGTSRQDRIDIAHGSR